MNAVSTARRGLLAVSVALGLVLTLGACTSSEPTTLTLAQSKSPVQLLRNETASRIPSALVADVVNASDGSVNCRTPETDPEGLSRQWKSSARIILTPEADLALVMSKLFISFREDGWEQGTYGTDTIIEFTRPDSVANIHITTSEKEGEATEIQVQVAGPCVMTGGESSDEVVKLEANAAAALE
jgi:hypothetical protein